MGAPKRTPEIDTTAAQLPKGTFGRGGRWMVAALGVVVVVLGGMLVFQVFADETATERNDVPDDVRAVIVDFLAGIENNDFAAIQEVVTDDFRRPDYLGDPYGGTPDRGVRTIEYFDSDMAFDIERVGEPIVRGAAPFYVSQAENWTVVIPNSHGDDLEFNYEGISTYVVVVDTDDQLRIDDGYWVGSEVSKPSE